MATSSIGGLISGLDTETLINQFMQLEAASQTKLISRLTSERTSLNSMQTLNSQVAGLATKAAELAKATSWNPIKASSSDSALTATATADAVAGSWQVQVDSLATQHRMRFNSTAATDAVVTGGQRLALTRGGETTMLDVGAGTLGEVVEALNASGTGLRASTLRLADDSYALVVTSSETGEASRFSLTLEDGSALLGGAVTTEAQDAAVTIEGHSFRSATNTFSDVLTGVTFTVGAAAVGKSVDVTLATDTTSAAAAVKALVDNLNNVIGQTQSLTAFNSSTKATGLLAGEPAVRTLGSSLQESIYPSDLSSLAGFGIQTDRYGKVVFDQDVFNAALASDPAAVAAAITGPDGFAARVEKVASAASDPTDGVLTSAITGRTSSIDRLEDSIEAWDQRLALRRTSLERQYTALETALSKMQNQSNWLTSQLGSLTSPSSS